VVQYLVGKDTVDEQIWRRLEHKLNVCSSALDGHAQSINAKSVQSAASSKGSLLDDEFVAGLLAQVMEFEQRDAQLVGRRQRRDERNALAVAQYRADADADADTATSNGALDTSKRSTSALMLDHPPAKRRGQIVVPMGDVSSSSDDEVTNRGSFVIFVMPFFPSQPTGNSQSFSKRQSSVEWICF